MKDIVIRYHRMRGEHVVGARGGWDTHGLPVEIEVEKELGFRGKPDIEAYGIAEFNRACKESVRRYIQDWERMTERIAFWIDMERPYSTYDNDYIESLWWILKTLWDRELLFRDYKVTMHCPRCGTSLSDHEVSLGFEDDVDDPSVWVRFRHRPGGHPLDDLLAGAAFLAWTTTPWTLPANAALAVKPGAPYVLVEYRGGGAEERLVLAEPLAAAVLGEGTFEVLERIPGERLGGVAYEPLFTGMPESESGQPDTADRVVVDEFVSLEDGTGIVHIAPAYGDLAIGRKFGLPTRLSVDLAGRTVPALAPLGFGDRFFKEADPLITRHLRDRGLLFRSERVRHAYPFCWRCHTPLLYYAKPSWYIRTTARKERLLANNQRIHWVPEHIRDGRFGNWLENNVDWALSRERYWGTPLPIWICDGCARVEVLGSVAELSERAGRDLGGLDLHRPYVDEVTWTCRECRTGTVRRVPDVADCWFDSGSMPVAQWHYPFENRELFATAGQADYISEAIDQTRGWFYTLHAVSTLLFDRPAFENAICLGHILDIQGEKMSKSRGNVVDPWQLLADYGADATRWYMYASAPPYNPRRFAPDHVERGAAAVRAHSLEHLRVPRDLREPGRLAAPRRGAIPSRASGSRRSTAGRWPASTRSCATSPPGSTTTTSTGRPGRSSGSWRSCPTGTCAGTAAGSGRPKTTPTSGRRTPRCTRASRPSRAWWRRSCRSWPRRSTGTWCSGGIPARRRASTWRAGRWPIPRGSTSGCSPTPRSCSKRSAWPAPPAAPPGSRSASRCARCGSASGRMPRPRRSSGSGPSCATS